MSAEKKKVLVIRLSALGDVAMTLPVIYSVCRNHTDTDFFLLTRPFFAKLFINRPDNLHIIEADFKGKHHGISGLARLISELGTYKFSAVADLHNILRSWVIDIWMKIHGKKVVMVDKKRIHRIGNLLREPQPNFIDRYANVFAKLGYPINLDFKSIFADNPAEAPFPVQHPAVGIAPFARYDNKTYPIDQMQRVVQMLTEQGYNVYLFGARDKEAEVLEKWSATYPHCHSVAGKTDITGELALMSHLDVMVAMDSANHHLASLTGTPVVSIWGSTAPQCGFHAYGQPATNAVLAHLDCQPCTVAGSKKCPKGTLACMREIPPEVIVNKIKDICKFSI